MCFHGLIAQVISINSNPHAPDWEEEIPAQLLLSLPWWQPVLPAAWLTPVLDESVIASNS